MSDKQLTLAICNQDPQQCDLIPAAGIDGHKYRILLLNQSRPVDQYLTYTYIPVSHILRIWRHLMLSQDPQRPVLKIRIGMNRDFNLVMRICDATEKPTWSHVTTIAPWAGVFILPMPPGGIDPAKVIDNNTGVTGNIIRSKMKRLAAS
jgi:hypothetical protein